MGKNYPLLVAWTKSHMWQLRPRNQVMGPVVEFGRFWGYGHQRIKCSRGGRMSSETQSIDSQIVDIMLRRNRSHYWGSRYPLPNPLAWWLETRKGSSLLIAIKATPTLKRRIVEKTKKNRLYNKILSCASLFLTKICNSVILVIASLGTENKEEFSPLHYSFLIYYTITHLFLFIISNYFESNKLLVALKKYKFNCLTSKSIFGSNSLAPTVGPWQLKVWFTTTVTFTVSSNFTFLVFLLEEPHVRNQWATLCFRTLSNDRTTWKNPNSEWSFYLIHAPSRPKWIVS